MKKIVKILMYITIVFVIAVVVLLKIGGKASKPGEWAEGKPLHHTVNGFRNYPVTRPQPKAGFGFIFKRVKTSMVLPEVPDNHYLTEDKSLAMFEASKGENTVTWIGQSTLLIRLDNVIILTDPFFDDYAGSFYMGPRRIIKPGISLDRLPKVDVLLISHNHYDHLDSKAVEALPDKDQVTVFVPLGLKTFFNERGFSQVYELDWNKSISFQRLKFTSFPAVHYSGRTLVDKNETLWCSWGISSNYSNLYFCGDTAWSENVFYEIGRKYGPFDLAFIPIGTYGNRIYGFNNHVNPEEAVKIALDTRSNILAAIHWGTVIASDEPPFEPPDRFKQAAGKKNIAPERLWILKIGETRNIPQI